MSEEKEIDREIRVMREVFELLKDLDQSTRRSIMTWVNAKIKEYENNK